MRCSCVILNYNDSERTASLARVLVSYDQVARVIVVDNCSPDGSWERLQQIADLPKAVLIQSGKNGGYGAGNNVGLRYCLDNPLDEPRQLVMLANPDTMISESAIAETVECFEQHPKAVVCAPWEYDANTGEPYASTAWEVPSAFVYMMQFLVLGSRVARMKVYSPSELTDRFQRVGALSGALIMLDARHFADLGLYDEGIFLFCEENSLGVRAAGRFESYLCTRERYTHEFSTSIRTSLPNFRKRTGILSRARRRVLLEHYKVGGAMKAATQLCYGISLIEAWPLAWAYNIYCLIREKKQ